MRYGEAFRKLGYALEIPRTDWSAQHDAGVCLTLWRNEIHWTGDPITLDTGIIERRRDEWLKKPGNQKRRKHIQFALDNFDGWVDAIIVDGSSASGVEKATPWQPAERHGLKWKVVNFDPETGHFKIDALKIG